MNQLTPTPMRCCLVSIGSHGDVAPFVALGQELRRRGHEVVLVVLQPYTHLVEAAGLRAAPVPLGTEALWPHQRLLRSLMLAQSGATWLGMSLQLGRAAATVVDTLLAAAKDADMLVSGVVTSGAAATLARHHGLPSSTVLLGSLLPGSTDAQAVLAPAGAPAPLARLVSSVMWQMTRVMGASHTRQAARRLGSRPRPHTDATLIATSRLVSPPDPGWPAGVTQVGWLASPPPSEALPADLDRWLDDHRDAVFMGFGSVLSADPGSDLALFRAAARRARRPLVVQTELLPLGVGDGDLFNVPRLDHRLLMPRVAGVVHHGGAGTTYTAVISGRPQVLAPHLGDQPYYARRVRQLGVGTSAGPRWRLNAAGLARALARALEPGVAARAQALGEQLGSEDGTARAADSIEALRRPRTH